MLVTSEKDNRGLPSGLCGWGSGNAWHDDVVAAAGDATDADDDVDDARANAAAVRAAIFGSGWRLLGCCCCCWDWTAA